MKRNTIQKHIIIETLREMNCHASAGMVYEEINKQYPTISKATVYRVLTEAADAGELLRLRFAETDDRFDITLPPHAHIACRCCGAVQDMTFKTPWNPIDELADDAGFIAERYHIELTGLCPACRENGSVLEKAE